MKLFSMTKTIFKTLGRGPSTIRYPKEPAKRYEGTRGQVEIKIEDCIFCGLCSMHCPSDAITVDKPVKIWTIDRFRCISCNSCVEACPKNCLCLNNVYHEPVLNGPLTESFTGSAEPAEVSSEN
ncbi:MAG: 4Fe-4S dicluster domain-containing protein [Methanomicrobiaceae archaeon]|nr:4Fe-4S dicluster domain-containing protein [Methanomicrobiaceae archaeon]